MDISWWTVHLAVFAASLLQAATGIGFGVIAGPILLLILNSSSAIQVSIILSLVIALTLAPSVYKVIDRSVFRLLVYGTCAGIPLGIAVFLRIDIHTLKILAATAVAFMALTTLGVFRPRNPKSEKRYGKPAVIGIGIVSGAMSSSLGMPGPVPATWMITKSFSKEAIRATILILFIPSYLAALGVQIIAPGLGDSALSWSLTLLPATIAGVFAGKALEPRISELAFRRIITLVLICTSISLFADVASRVLGSC